MYYTLYTIARLKDGSIWIFYYSKYTTVFFMWVNLSFQFFFIVYLVYIMVLFHIFIRIIMALQSWWYLCWYDLVFFQNILLCILHLIPGVKDDWKPWRNKRKVCVRRIPPAWMSKHKHWTWNDRLAMKGSDLSNYLHWQWDELFDVTWL